MLKSGISDARLHKKCVILHADSYGGTLRASSSGVLIAMLLAEHDG